ncbi:MAG: amidase family protein [bacterium]|nr:amidase family protein [bacterium]
MKIAEYQKYDALGLAELVKEKQVTPLELVKVAISIIENINGKINAVVAKQYDRALERAQDKTLLGPFAGVPFLLKDLGAFEVGVPSTFGSKYCKDYIPKDESELVRRFKNAGFVTVGRTNTPEFGLHPTTEPKLHGATKNPWNLDHIAGGSSGGAAAAVASGMVPLAHGGDGGGSIRIPASCCGVFGLKPSEGRSPIGPSGGRAWHGLVVEHVLTRSVRDCAAVLDIVSARQVGAPIHNPPVDQPFIKQLELPPTKLRIAYVDTPFAKSSLHDDCRNAALDSARLCESLGHEVDPHQFKINSDDVTQAYLVIVAAETKAMLDRITEYLGRAPKDDEIELSSYLCALGGTVFRASEYAHAVRVMDETRRDIAHSFEDYDMVITPTLAMPPPKLGALAPTFTELKFLQLIKTFPFSSLVRKAFLKIPENGFKLAPYTFMFNITGQPAMSVPLHWNKDNLPIGTQFVGRHGAEGILLNLAQQLDKAKPFSNKLAPIGLINK